MYSRSIYRNIVIPKKSTHFAPAINQSEHRHKYYLRRHGIISPNTWPLIGRFFKSVYLHGLSYPRR